MLKVKYPAQAGLGTFESHHTCASLPSSLGQETGCAN